MLLGVEDWLGVDVRELVCVNEELCVSLALPDWLGECDCERVAVGLALPLSLGVCV